MTDAKAVRIILHPGKLNRIQGFGEAVADLTLKGFRVDARVAIAPGDAGDLARDAAKQGFDAVVICAGDGTVGEVAAALGGGERHYTALAVLPLGTANDFATACGIERDQAPAAFALLHHPARRIDLGSVNGRPFLNVASGGEATRFTAETPHESKDRFGGLAYFLTAFRQLGNLQSYDGTFTGPDWTWQGRFYAFAVGNGRLAGGAVPVCPDAVVDDGLLDVTVMVEAPVHEIAFDLPAHLNTGGQGGGFDDDGPIRRRRLPWVEVRVDQPVLVNLDGEPTEAREFRFEVRPGALACHLPENCPLLHDAVPEEEDI